MKPNYVYVASSWRNPIHIAVVAALQSVGIDHYDFRNPPNKTGFSWKEVDPYAAAGATGPVEMDRYLKMIDHQRSIEGFYADFDAMQRADTFVLVLPCGRSAHLELGWAVGRGKQTAILLEDPLEPELMYRMVDYLAPSLFDLLGWLGVEDA